jgi:hypothetical protein
MPLMLRQPGAHQACAACTATEGGDLLGTLSGARRLSGFLPLAELLAHGRNICL